MKLLMISGDRSIPEGKKGAFYYTLEEFSKHWDRIDVIVPRPSRRQKMESGKSMFGNVYFHPNPTNTWWQECWIRKIGPKLIKEHGHDVMTVHDYPPFYNGAGAMFLGKKTGIPYALEVHHIVGYPKAASLTEWLGRLMSRRYFRSASKKAEAVRVVNQDVATTLIKWGVEPGKIHNVSSLYLDRDVLSRVHQPSISYDVSFCARLVANKGLTELLDAVSQMQGTTLLVIGDGPERSKMEKKAKKLGISNRVTFLGWLSSQEAVSDALQTARIFVMNSKSEGGPRIALEAMGCGLPVISTKVGVMPEVIHDEKNGVFTTGTARDLVKKIGMLLKDEKQQKNIGGEAKKVLDRFERGTLITQYADFLKKLV